MTERLHRILVDLLAALLGIAVLLMSLGGTAYLLGLLLRFLWRMFLLGWE